MRRSSNVILSQAFRAQWGFHPGGWGKPPLDEYNRPLYGDVFGVLPKPVDPHVRSFNSSGDARLIVFRMRGQSIPLFGESLILKRKVRNPPHS